MINRRLLRIPLVNTIIHTKLIPSIPRRRNRTRRLPPRFLLYLLCANRPPRRTTIPRRHGIPLFIRMWIPRKLRRRRMRVCVRHRVWVCVRHRVRISHPSSSANHGLKLWLRLRCRLLVPRPPVLAEEQEECDEQGCAERHADTSANDEFFLRAVWAVGVELRGVSRRGVRGGGAGCWS